MGASGIPAAYRAAAKTSQRVQHGPRPSPGGGRRAAQGSALTAAPPPGSRSKRDPSRPKGYSLSEYPDGGVRAERVPLGYPLTGDPRGLRNLQTPQVPGRGHGRGHVWPICGHTHGNGPARNGHGGTETAESCG